MEHELDYWHYGWSVNSIWPFNCIYFEGEKLKFILSPSTSGGGALTAYFTASHR